MESHVAYQEAFISNLRKRLEASDEQPASTSTSAQAAQAAQVPAAAAGGQPTDVEKSWEREDATTADENASRQSVHVRCTLTASPCRCMRSQKHLRVSWIVLQPEFLFSSSFKQSVTARIHGSMTAQKPTDCCRCLSWLLFEFLKSSPICGHMGGVLYGWCKLWLPIDALAPVFVWMHT